MTTVRRLSFRELKRRISIERALADRGLLDGLRDRGGRLSGPCPIHGGDNPAAFHVDRRRNLWRCFTRCQAGGDLIELARRLCDGSWSAAGRWLNRLARRFPDEYPPPGHSNPAPRVNAPFRPFPHRIALDPDCGFLADKGIRPETARRFEAGRYHGAGFLAGCVGIRLHDPEGGPLGYAGRRLAPEAAFARGKWKFPRSFPKSSVLFNHHRARTIISRGLIVVEGPWDVIKLSQAGFPNAVALMGVSASLAQIRIISQAPSILLMMDGDRAGKAAADNIRSLFADHPDTRIVRLPEQKDPADIEEPLLRHLCARSSFFSSNQ